MTEIIDGIKPLRITKRAKVKLYKIIIEALENSDWDTQQECMNLDPAFDAAFRELHPDYFEDEDPES